MSKKKKNNPQQQEVSKNKLQKRKTGVTDKKKIWMALGGILLLTLIAYLPSLSNSFVNLDDDRYVENNQLIRAIDLKLFFSTFQVMGNYHPLVLFVYSIIYSFVQLDPKVYHLVNLCIHLVNTVLVLYVILELTDVFEIAVVVSLLFGIHPIHVESVAWVSELKDLMYTAFFLLSLFYYIRYIKNDFKRKFFILSILFFFLSVLSKGMGVSLSIVLLLIDYFMGRKFNAKIFIEKIPFLILSVIFGLVAIKAQQALGAVQDIALFSIPQRLVFACYGFITYIWKLIIPVQLSAYYPYPAKTGESIPAMFYGYPLIVIALLTAVYFSIKKSNKVFFGIGFYAVTVALVLQLIPVGGAIIADRYSYIPSIGILLLFAYGLYELYKSTAYKTIGTALLVLMTGCYTYMTYQRTQVWKDGMTLWSDVIDKGNEVALAYNNRGVLYKQEGELDKAMKDYKHSLQLNPVNEDTWSNIGLIFWQEGLKRPNQKQMFNDTAMYYLNKAISINPEFSTAYSNRGSVRSTMGDSNGALEDYTKSIQLDPNFNDAYYNRGIVYYNLGRKGEACNDLRQAAALGHAIAPNAVRDLCK
ncbi:MAG: tetratricopeptide repeat protein [Bacteroidota bacterium]